MTLKRLEDTQKYTKKLSSYNTTPHTMVKLVTLHHLLSEFVNQNKNSSKLGYIDVLAGPGLNKVKYQNHSKYILGSPLIATHFQEPKCFSELFFNEPYRRFYNVLKHQLSRNTSSQLGSQNIHLESLEPIDS